MKQCLAEMVVAEMADLLSRYYKDGVLLSSLYRRHEDAVTVALSSAYPLVINSTEGDPT